MARSTRNQPFCWQEKKILRLFRKLFSGNELSKFRNLYGAITEMDSDFNNQDIKFYTKTISTYSGLSEDWIPKGLKKLEELKIIAIEEDRVNGKFKGKRLIFTPENIDDSICDTITVKSTNGKSINGFLESSEDISLLEDSIYKEEVNCKDTPNNSLDTSFYKNIGEFKSQIEKITDNFEVKRYLLDYYTEYTNTNNNYNHYRIKDEVLIGYITAIENILEHIDFNYGNAERIKDEYLTVHFSKEKHSLKHFCNEKSFIVFLTSEYSRRKSEVDKNYYYYCRKEESETFGKPKNFLSEVI